MTTIPAHAASTPFDHIGLNAVGGRRLCGPGRIAGAVYAESAICLTGVPLDQYIYDPPVPIDPNRYSLKKRGTNIVRAPDGTTHVFDWIGSDSYPEASDFLEEARRMGISRKIDAATARQLTPKSFITLIHARGYLTNPHEVAQGVTCTCPNLRHGPGEPCSALHYAVPGDASGQRHTTHGPYDVLPRAPGTPDGVYQPGIIMSIPISAISVVRNHDGSVNPAALAAVRASGFEPSIVDA